MIATYVELSEFHDELSIELIPETSDTSTTGLAFDEADIPFDVSDWDFTKG